MAFVYLVHLNKLNCNTSGNAICKVGMGRKERPFQHDGEVLFMCHVKDALFVEAMIKDKFNMSFIRRTDLKHSKETFEGDLMQMQKIFVDTVLQFRLSVKEKKAVDIHDKRSGGQMNTKYIRHKQQLQKQNCGWPVFAHRFEETWPVFTFSCLTCKELNESGCEPVEHKIEIALNPENAEYSIENGHPEICTRINARWVRQYTNKLGKHEDDFPQNHKPNPDFKSRKRTH